MKKYLALLLALVLALSLAACGGSSDESDTGDSTDAQATETTDAEATTDASADTGASDTSLWSTVTREAVPDLAGTTWNYSGGYINGAEMTQEELTASLETYGGKLQFVFADDSNVSMVQGTGSLNGTYAADPDQENCIDITFPDKNLTYACIFATNTSGAANLIAIPAADGMNGIYFTKE